MARKYTKELLEPLVKESYSLAEVIRKLGLKEAGGTYSHIGRVITRLGIDRSHFLGRGANQGVRHKGNLFIGRSSEEILVIRTDGLREHGKALRKALINSGVEYVCESCGTGNQWNKKPLVLEVDHRNSNWSDNRKENLRFLCPNCHSQEDSMAFVRKHKPVCPKCGGKKQVKSQTCGPCSYKKTSAITEGSSTCRCGNHKSKNASKCKACENRFRVLSGCTRKVKDRPSLQTLEEELSVSNYLAVGRKYGVSDNTVRKWLKYYRKQASMGELIDPSALGADDRKVVPV